MATKPTLPELVRRKVREIDADLDRIARLQEQHGDLGLDIDTLNEAYNALSDYKAQISLFLFLEDPRAPDTWRQSNEGKALERLRLEDRMQMNARSTS